MNGWSEHPESKALRRLSPLKELGLLCGVLLLVGWHYSKDHTPGPGEPVLLRSNVGNTLFAGAGKSAARSFSSSESFRMVPAAGFGRLGALDSAELLTVLKLNRIDISHARRGNLIVPDSIGEELSYAPFPARLPSLDSVPKFIVVSRRVQAFGAYENGTLVRWGPTSTGKQETPTDTGLFFTNWRSKQAISTEDSTWVLNWYFNIMAVKGVAFHEYDLPGRPASHGCVRLLEEDAHWIYDWAEQWEVPTRQVVRTPTVYGTPVVIMGEYDYGRRAPWLELAENPGATTVGIEEVETTLAGYLPTVLERIRR